MNNLLIYPGGDLIAKGLDDLRRGLLTEEALLASVAAPRLRQLGLEVATFPDVPAIPEHALFERIEQRVERGAHMAYNALLARAVGFTNAFSIATQAGRRRHEP